MTGPIFTLFMHSKEKCKRGIVEYLIGENACCPRRAVDAAFISRLLGKYPWRVALGELVRDRIVVPIGNSPNYAVGTHGRTGMRVYLNIDRLLLYVRRVRLRVVVTLILFVIVFYALPLIRLMASRPQVPLWQLRTTEQLTILILSIICWILTFPQYLVWLVRPVQFIPSLSHLSRT